MKKSFAGKKNMTINTKDAVVPYFLLKELKKGYLDGVEGVYHTPKGYFVDEKEAAKFDAQFPPKEKLKLPGQLV